MLHLILCAVLLFAAAGSASENLVRNGGFEEVGTDGWASRWSRGDGCTLDRIAAAGEWALKIQRGDAGVTQVIRLQPGRRYEVAAAIRTRGVVAVSNDDPALASFRLEYHDAAGQPVGTVEPEGLGSSLDWSTLTCITPPVPESQVTTTLTIRLSGTTTSGRAWFDEVSVREREEPALDVLMLYPNYRGLLGERTWEPTLLRLRCSIGTSAGPLSGLLVQTQVRDDRGQVLWADSPTPPPARTFEKGFDLRWILRGSYLTSLSLRSSAGALLAERLLPFEVSHVTDLFSLPTFVRADNTLLIRGSPFFPIGMIDAFDPEDAAALDERLSLLRSSPFNVLLNDELPQAQPKVAQRIIADLARNGVMSVFPLDDYDGIGGRQAGDILPSYRGATPGARLRDCVKTHRGDAGLLSWYTADDMAPQYSPFVEARYADLEALDPEHPVVLAEGGTTDDDVRWFARASDGHACRPRMIGNTKPLDAVASGMDAIQAAFAGYRPAWAIFKLYDGSGKPLRRNDLRALTYLAIAHGAKGILYESIADILADPASGSLWKSLTNVASEVRTLTGYLTNGASNPAPGINRASLAADSRCITLGDRTILIVVNRRSSSVAARVEFTTSIDKIDVLFENRLMRPVGGIMTDTFAPLGVHVYEYPVSGP